MKKFITAATILFMVMSGLIFVAIAFHIYNQKGDKVLKKLKNAFKDYKDFYSDELNTLKETKAKELKSIDIKEGLKAAFKELEKEVEKEWGIGNSNSSSVSNGQKMVGNRMQVIGGQVGKTRSSKSETLKRNIEYGIQNKEVLKSKPRTQNTKQKVSKPATQNPQLNERQQQLYSYLKKTKEASMQEMGKFFSDVSQRTLRRDMDKFEEMGLVQQNGKTRNSLYKIKNSSF